MIEQRYATLGKLKAPILVYALTDLLPPATLDQIPEAQRKLLEQINAESNNNMVYRGVLPIVRELICGFVEEASGVERNSKIVGKTKGGKDIVQWEADGAYVKRAASEKNWTNADDEIDLSQFQDKLDEACRGYKEADDAAPEPLAVDLSGRERKAPVSAKLAAKYKLIAAKVLVNNTWERANSQQFVKINKTFTPTGDTAKMFTGTYPGEDGQDVSFNVSDKDADTLGRLIKEYSDWKALEEAKSF